MLLGMSLPAAGQVDTTLRTDTLHRDTLRADSSLADTPLADTLRSDTLALLSSDSLVQPEVDTTLNRIRQAMGRLDSTATTFAPLQSAADTLGVAQRLRLQVGRLGERLRDELPELVEDEAGKTRLALHFPWRDDIVVPFPEGLLPAPIPPPYDPDVAWQRSLVVPGWGQVYNRGYWKIPVFYLGYAAAGWWINYSQQQYLRYRRNYYCAVGVENCTVEPQLAGLDATGLRNRRNQFRQYRDYGIIGLAGWHLLQVVEAYIDAHLNDFDVSEDLSYRVVPTVSPVVALGVPLPALGVGLRF
ncbi:MAG: hypothetical protein OHK0039_27260 [Bacteroidia bacterium]